MEQNIYELVRKAEDDYLRGSTLISKHVTHSMADTLDRIDAYANSKHISGDKDALGRDKPFFNISVAAMNIWFRATDIDRSDIKVRATKSKDWINSFLATIKLQDWMRKEHFSSFLNEWGRVLARYGSAVVKFVEDSDGLHISVVPWNTLIVDSVNFDQNIKIEIIELTEAELVGRIKTHGYDKTVVKELIDALQVRETKEKQKKDTKNDYIKLYEVHGNLELSLFTEKDKDDDEFAQQMHVVSFVGTRNGRNTDYQDFALYKGLEKKDPYMLTHLIKEDGRTLGIGAIEHLFESQWMVNHSVKGIKDSLDLANKVIFQTGDNNFVGRNVLDNIETGEILIHSPNAPLTLLNNQALNVTSAQNFAVQWKSIGNEITGVSEAMLGVAPKSGTAWKQTEALLQESHSLFELMTENKGLHIVDMLTNFIIPYIRRKELNNADEISATLSAHEIDKIDGLYIKNEAIRLTNRMLVDKVLAGENVTPEEQALLTEKNQTVLQEGLNNLGTQRFFAPSEINWKEQFKDLEWELEIDITGEAKNVQEALTTLNNALKLVVTPGFEQNKKAQLLVGRILEMTGTMSPIEYNSIQPTPSVATAPPVATPPTTTGALTA